MSIELCVLASGSSGNCSVIRAAGGVMLIDCGIGPRIVAQRLIGTGVQLADVKAICLTHLDSDHFSAAWVRTIVRQAIAVYCHASCVDQLVATVVDERFAQLVRPFDCEIFEPIPHLCARPVALAHDEEGSYGFLLEACGSRMGYATDLGHVPDPLFEQFVNLDVLAIESNYDRTMQEQSPRPFFLKRRIMGGKGHLSNQQALNAVRRILDRCQKQALDLPAHIVLLHRSRQCNCPDLLRKLFSADARIAPRLVLAEQYTRTEWLAAAGRPVGAGEQLLLSWG
jgi:phosphoribosyl 1,2-cyclic phosphodiesterase